MNLSYRNQRNAEIIAAYWKKPIDKPDWYSVNALAENTAEIFIYDVIGWPYNDVGELIRTMSTIKDKPILARINSPGGDVWDGTALLNAFINHPGGVTVRIESLAASMASVLAMGGRKTEAYPNTMMMIHDSWVCVAGNRIELMGVADLLEQVDENMMDAYAKKTKIGKRELRDMMHAETWMNAKTMKEKGFIDSIIESGKAAKAQFDLSMFAHTPDIFDGPTDNSEPAIRKYEKALRDAGASKSEARTILARGLKSVNLVEEIAAQLKKTISIIGGN